MNKEDIVFLKSIKPITLLDSEPSKETVTLLNYLLQIFSETIPEHRKLLKIPENGLDINDYIGLNLMILI
jgi:hypothetical protein